MHINTIKIYIYNDDEKCDKVLKYINKNNCNYIKKELFFYYTNIGKIIKQSNQIKK